MSSIPIFSVLLLFFEVRIFVFSLFSLFDNLMCRIVNIVFFLPIARIFSIFDETKSLPNWSGRWASSLDKTLSTIWFDGIETYERCRDVYSSSWQYIFDMDISSFRVSGFTTSIPFYYFFFFGSLIFFIGIIGIILQRKNLILIFFNIELMFLGLSVNFVTFNYFNDDWRGSIAVLLIVGVAAAESVLGLSIVIAIYRLKNSLSVFSIRSLYD